MTMFIHTTPTALQHQTRSTLEYSLPFTSSASDPADPVHSPSSIGFATTEKRPASPPAGLSPLLKLLSSRVFTTCDKVTGIEGVQLSSSDVDNPTPMGQEGEEDPLVHVAERPI